VRQRQFISLLGCAATVWSLAAHADSPPKRATKAAATKFPHIEIVRATPVDQPPETRRLGNELVDLMKDFSLSSSEAIGSAWKMPSYIAVSGATFDERFGQW
jgi:hypothetical protein